MSTLRTLITNDDGIASPGLHALAAVAVEAGLDVVVAAPAAEASGSSASIAAAESDGRIVVERVEIDGLAGVTCHGVAAPPALIALIAAHGAFGPAPGLVLSGVNRGANVGRAILHSGTVGAALTAGVNGARGVAVSLGVGVEPCPLRWDTAAGVIRTLMPGIVELPAGTVLNLNVPCVDHDRVLGLRDAPLAPFGVVQTTMTEQNEGDVRLTVAEDSGTHPPGTDAALLAEGYATLTSITSISEISASEVTEGLTGRGDRSAHV